MSLTTKADDTRHKPRRFGCFEPSRELSILGEREFTMVDFVSVALDIISAAKVIKDTIDEVRGFKTRNRRLGNRIQCLMPAVQLLAEMKDKKDELTAVITHSFGDDIKVFGIALEELKKCLEEAKLFMESLHKMDALTKAWRKKEINGQFDWFGDHLNELQGTIQFGILVEMREVLYGHAAKEEIRRQMEMIKEESRKLFERRRDEDLEDELKDQLTEPSLLETMATTASDVMTIANSVQEASCGAKQFKSRCHRLSNSIQCLMPAMLVLIDTQARKCERSAIRMQDSDLELKVIAQSLGQLKDCVQGARVFLEPFKYMDIITKTMNKGLLKRQFCMFSERLDVLQKGLDYDLLTSIIKRLGKGDTLKRRKKPKRVPAVEDGEPSMLKPELDLLGLSKKIAFQWEEIGVYLGLHQYCIKSIDSNFRYQCVQEKAFDMLVKWREYVPRDVDATLLLARALRACGLNDVAKELERPPSNLRTN